MLAKKINVTRKVNLILTILYIYIPIFVFLVGYVKWYITLPTVMLVIYFLFFMVKGYLEEDINYRNIKVSVYLIVVICLLIGFFCVSIGMGGFFSQSGDWFKHNAILHDLCERKWPVYYTEKETSMLTYYIGQYLVPSLIGKVTGSFRYAEIALLIWAVIGICLVYFNLLRIVRADNWKKQLVTLLIFLFFSGALILAQSILKGIYPDEIYMGDSRHWIIVNNIMLQYRSNLVMMRWVFPQCIVPWLIAELFLEYHKRIEYYVLLFLPSVLFGTFSIIAFLVFACSSVVYHALQTRGKDFWKKCFSLANVLTAISLGTILFFYFWGYVRVQKPDYLMLQMQSYGISYLFVYVTFCLCMFGIYAICIFEENKKNFIYYISIALLLSIPCFKMGLYNDFVMCVSIPVLFILMIYIMQFLFNESNHAKTNIKKGIIIMCLLIGAWYPFCELQENIAGKQLGNMTADGYTSMKYFTDRNDREIPDDLKYNYYTYDLENATFYQVFARKKIK